MNKKIVLSILVITLVFSSSNITSAKENDVTTQKIEQFKEETGRVDSKFGLNTDIVKPMVGNYELYGYDEDYHNGSPLYAAFDASLDDNGFGSSMNGQSRAFWSGANPYYCDEIVLETAVQLTGIGISVTVGSSGFDVSGGLTSKTLSMDDTIEDDYRKYQNYSNVTFDGVDLYYRHTATAKFTFGVNTYYTNATDSVWP